MPQVSVKQIVDEFPFLDDRTAQEPFVYEILCEIKLYQKEGYKKGTGGFATRETISTSRNIHIPFTPARDKNIDYILELLTTRYHEWVQVIVTFDFAFDEYAKKLTITEKEEYGLNIGAEEHDQLQTSRDEISLNNYLQFIEKFRLFNLDKMIRRAKNRDALNKVIQKGLGISFFTYNHFSIEKGKTEIAEEYCFHANNYEPVKKSLNMVFFKSTVVSNGEFIKSRLRKFGIMNADFSDYRDTKIDYILSILLDDIGSHLPDKDRAEVKTFKSLRQCILQVDKILDPVKIYNTDIVAYLRKNAIAAATELSSNVINITPEILSQWETPERLMKEHIIKEKDSSGIFFFIDGTQLANLFAAAIEAFKKGMNTSAGPDAFYQSKTALLHSAAKQVLIYATAQALIGGTEQDVLRLSHLSGEYEALLKKRTVQQEAIRHASYVTPKKRPLIVRMISFFSSMFSSMPAESEITGYRVMQDGPSGEVLERREPRKETTEVFENANAKKGPIAALSDLIELKPENEQLVLRIIQELRDNNLKIVVPIYNARTTLYPKRSNKLLMSDVEYLLVPIQVIKSIDTISDYINSLVGFKLKDEPIPNRGLVALEKYLRVLHRQRRVSQMRKKDQREKEMKR